MFKFLFGGLERARLITKEGEFVLFKFLFGGLELLLGGFLRIMLISLNSSLGDWSEIYTTKNKRR